MAVILILMLKPLEFVLFALIWIRRADFHYVEMSRHVVTYGNLRP